MDGDFPHVPDLAVSMDIVISGKSEPFLRRPEDNNTLLISRAILRTLGDAGGSTILARTHQPTSAHAVGVPGLGVGFGLSNICQVRRVFPARRAG